MTDSVTDFDPVWFGSLVSEVCKRRGVSCRRAAKQARVGVATMSRVMNGTAPSIFVYYRLVAWIRRPTGDGDGIGVEP